MNIHEAAHLIPRMSEDEFKELKADIKANGLLEPITVYQDQIIDGRHRFEACKQLGIEPKYQQWSGEGSLVSFVVSKNLRRRSLTSSQRAAISLDIEKAFAEEAKERQKGGQGGVLLTERFPEGNKGEARDQTAKVIETNPHYVTDAKKLQTDAPDLLKQVKDGDLTIPKAMLQLNKAKNIAHLNSIETQKAKAIEGVYDVVVLDPAWQMEKIKRDVAPNQVGFDYPTMSLEEIRSLKIPCADNCHVWLWTTQKYLPEAFKILEHWHLKYICQFTWHKNGGFQPFGLPQFNSEFALYARKGNPIFTETKDFMTCFNAKRTGHSKKPEEFYDMVRRVTAGRRLDMFNRRKIAGFDGWGNESV